MIQRVGILGLTVCLYGLMWGCGDAAQPTCPNGWSHFTPGCGDNGNFKAGCYATCEGSSTCGSEEECKVVSVTPACASAPPGQPVCGACSQEISLCVPLPQPIATNCKAGQEHHTPGCGDNNNFKAGCYTRCQSDSECDAGEACKDATVTPACAKASGTLACDACAEATKLCMAK